MKAAATAVYRPVAGGGQAVAYTSTPARTVNPIRGRVTDALIWSSTDCHIAFGSNTVDATTSDTILPANQMAAFKINPGEYVSAVQVSAGGTLYVSELTR